MKLVEGFHCLLSAVVVLAVLPGGAIRAGAEDEAVSSISAEEILEMARRSYASQDFELIGNLRQGLSRTPFRLSMRKGLIRFTFSNPKQALQLEFHEKRYLLWELLKGGNSLVEEERYALPVRETDISYEDLAMRYLFWPGAVLVGEESLKRGTCWKVAAKNPDEFGPYRHVILWIDQRSGGLAQIEGYDRENRLVRRMKVIEVQQIDGLWMLKLMRVERFDALSGKVIGRTYLEVGDPGKKKPGFFNKG